MELLTALGPFVPLLQTGVWALLLLVGFLWLRPQLRKLADALVRRIQAGSSFKAGPIEVGELRQLPYAPPGEVPAVTALPRVSEPSTASPSALEAPNWPKEREEMYRSCRGVFLAHVISPSQKPGQRFDVFIFLVRHKSVDFDDVEYADFFLGHYWGNRVFKEENRGRPIGVSTSAYGPLLCTCRVHFRDGYTALISRYVDFEMGRLLDSQR